ncbi:hypothetical protein Slin15195_G047480 [Septoria linicola]|uniref:Uncharacterized protein n=1 Tax=Septoria linicola TaxID=215465 RepID=A0A9Q9ANI4_9PEZI|nr:hypothetical protein Slin14017_G051010 [Septoria linicola]USW51429.1 hypothetical protein Slin15195_G047480 [Septoria linicola]
MDDWQEAALTNRHLHNRVGKHGRGKGGKSNGGFDVQKTLGTYEVKCHAAGKLVKENGSSTGIGKLEVYHLNEAGNALVGELFLPEVLHGTVLLTGSRKTMKAVVRSFEFQEEVESDTENAGVDAEVGIERQSLDDSLAGEGAKEEAGEGDAEEEEHTGVEAEDREERSYKEFEKNSFRSPKFWMKWQGQILAALSDRRQSPPSEGGDRLGDQVPVSEAVMTDKGYLVFASNNCEKFQGTLSCEALEWDNVKVQGWKLRNHTARDFEVHWETKSY